MKSQSLIVQFMLFFLIGLTVFLAISQLFKFYSDTMRREIVNSSLKLSNSFISSAIITAVDSCKECDIVKLSTKLEKAAGYLVVASLENGLNNSIATGDYFFSSIHNLNETLNIQPSKVSSLRPLTLTFNRTNYNLMMIQ